MVLFTLNRIDTIGEALDAPGKYIFVSHLNSSESIVVPLATTDAALRVVGGKARSLASLASAGLPVPDGFIITTRAYQDFIEANALADPVARELSDIEAARVDHFVTAEYGIKALFTAASLPEAIEQSICLAYDALIGDAPVAVRSSATAEDLPGLSFAGQQDSYLNIRGQTALLDAVRNCWASLWNARAISYRTRMGVDHATVMMAVVVQKMVAADVSGVLFTANPATGDRTELVVNASFGLGAAIVEGQVTPDSYVLNREDLAVKTQVTGNKAEMTVADLDQGTRTQTLDASMSRQSSLSADMLTQLGRLSLKAEQQLGGQPQDIEWAFAGASCWLLQSRPITNLPISELQDVSWLPPAPEDMLLRRQVVENMPEPLSPLFEDLYLGHGLDTGMDVLIDEVMELPFDLGEIISRPMFVTVNGYGYSRYNLNFTWRFLLKIPRILWWYVRTMPRLLRTLVPLWRNGGLPDYLAVIETWKLAELERFNDSQLLSGIRALTTADASYWFYITMMVGFAKVTEAMLNRFLSSKIFKGELISAMFLRGFPSKTGEAQENLERIAELIRANDELTAVVLNHPAQDLLALLKEQQPDNIFQQLAAHLETYGHQIYNLDFVEPTQAEAPLPLLLSLQARVSGAGDGKSFVQRQAEMLDQGQRLVMQTRARLGPVRRWVFGKLLAWAKNSAPNREESLFYMGAAWPALRRLAFALGQRLVEKGTLRSANGVFYLTGDELAQASTASEQGVACTELAGKAQQREALREARKRLHPPARVPQDLRFKFGPFDFTRIFEVWETQKHNRRDSDTLAGFAVSAGRVTGVASVILSPADFDQMKPDTILVCPTTTPAWTPLFTQASALVTDIGGILAHGSIIAREYGIPAVLGTGIGTERIVSGQVITVDGTAGTVTIVE